MAIKNVPIVTFNGLERPYGGVIYGLNMNIGYSSEASKLTIDIVNENGRYSTPSLNSQASVRFGNFRFNGRVWSYNLKESSAENTLQVTLVDNSIVLDRFYVLLWKRGFLGEMGTKTEVRKTFDFSGESILVPKLNKNLDGFAFTQFEEKTLGSQTESSSSYALEGGSKKIGNVILVGREKFANSVCDIPDTYYTFDDLRRQIPANMSSAPRNSIWKSTHEGTLREVLSSWCSDLGFDYYWDYSSNTLKFFSVSEGIGDIPSISNSSIISKETSASMEGTFRQYGIGYTQMPRSPVKSLTRSRSIVILSPQNPYPLSYFINKIGAPQPIDADSSNWGANRNEDEFVHAAFLGFVSRSLRDLFSFRNQHWDALGYQESGISADRKKIVSALKKYNYAPMISDLENLDAEDLPSYDFYFINRDPTVADKWHEIEQSLLQYHGRFYRSADSSGSFFYCNSNYTIEVEISVDPEGQVQEDNSENFAGRKIIERGGAMSHDTVNAQKALNMDKLKNEIQNCSPIHMDLKESGLMDGFITSKLLTGEQSKKFNTLLIVPNDDKFVRKIIGFRSSTSRGTNPLEMTIRDQTDSNIKSGKKNCPQYEENLKKGTCKSLEEIAREKAIKKAGGEEENKNEDDYVSGLVTATAKFCNIELKTGKVKIYAPSDGQLQVVCRYNVTVNKISTTGTEQFLWSAGRPDVANDVAEIRINSENITDPDEDSFQSKRSKALIKPMDAKCTRSQRQIKYVFAGAPQGVSLNPSNGLSNLDVSLSSDGFTTTATFSTQPPKLSKANNTLRYVQSQFNRASFNSS